MIAPGRTYRVDSDAHHSPMFHQVEGLWIDENISFADLKGVHRFPPLLREDDLQVRFRPSYFPPPSRRPKIDMKFESGPLKGKWLEISGLRAGAPSVVRNFGLDPESATSVSLSVPGSNASPCCATASAICVCSSRAICAFEAVCETA